MVIRSLLDDIGRNPIDDSDSAEGEDICSNN
jgi:hypothetical protein